MPRAAAPLCQGSPRCLASMAQCRGGLAVTPTFLCHFTSVPGLLAAPGLPRAVGPPARCRGAAGRTASLRTTGCCRSVHKRVQTARPRGFRYVSRGARCRDTEERRAWGFDASSAAARAFTPLSVLLAFPAAGRGFCGRAQGS